MSPHCVYQLEKTSIDLWFYDGKITYMKNSLVQIFDSIFRPSTILNDLVETYDLTIECYFKLLLSVIKFSNFVYVCVFVYHGYQ